MADEMAEQIAEAKKRMLAGLQPHGGKITVLVRGAVKVESTDPAVEIKKMD